MLAHLHSRKLKVREVKGLAQEHRAFKLGGQNDTQVSRWARLVLWGYSCQRSSPELCSLEVAAEGRETGWVKAQIWRRGRGHNFGPCNCLGRNLDMGNFHLGAGLEMRSHYTKRLRGGKILRQHWVSHQPFHSPWTEGIPSPVSLSPPSDPAAPARPEPLWLRLPQGGRPPLCQLSWASRGRGAAERLEGITS